MDGRVNPAYDDCKYSGARNQHNSLRGPKLRLHLIKQVFDLRAFQTRDIVLIFEQYAERIRHRRRIECGDVELGERAGPVEGLGDARRLELILFA